jgi:hypothetical protein
MKEEKEMFWSLNSIFPPKKKIKQRKMKQHN